MHSYLATDGDLIIIIVLFLRFDWYFSKTKDHNRSLQDMFSNFLYFVSDLEEGAARLGGKQNERVRWCLCIYYMRPFSWIIALNSRELRRGLLLYLLLLDINGSLVLNFVLGFFFFSFPMRTYRIGGSQIWTANKFFNKSLLNADGRC